jgi:hypothetical protein
MAGLLIDQLPTHAVTGGAVEHMKRDSLGCRGGCVKRRRAAQLRELEKPFPASSRPHFPFSVA